MSDARSLATCINLPQCADTMGWQLRLGRMGELIKVEGAGKSLLFAIGLVRPIHNRAMTVLARP